MGYLMRFISTDKREIHLSDIDTALRQIDNAYAINSAEIPDLGDLMYKNTHLAIIEIDRPGNDMFEDDLTEFHDLVGAGTDENVYRVRETLTNARALVIVEAIWHGDDAESVLDLLDPLWYWLFTNYTGLSQADNEGFYDQSGLILERTFTL